MNPFIRMAVDFLAVVGGCFLLFAGFVAWVIWRDERWWRRMRGE